MTASRAHGCRNFVTQINALKPSNGGKFPAMYDRGRILWIGLAAATLASCADVQSALDRADRYLQGVVTSISGEPPPQSAVRKTSPGTADDQAASAEADYRDGLRYLYGNGVPKDERRAAILIERAASRGYVEAQYLLAATYAPPDLPIHDPALATMWRTRAAIDGHAQAQYELADAYTNGRDVTKEPAWAAMWYRRAALNGQRDAAFFLGLLYVSGTGVPVDEPEAYKWLLVAEAAGKPEATRYREALAGRLDRQARTTAEAAARAFRPTVRSHLPDDPLLRFTQFALAQSGHAVGAVDGRFGPATKTALIAYQRSKGLRADGGLSERVVEALRADLRASG